MSTFDLSRCKLAPFAHQREGIRVLCEKPTFALFDEMGVGKTLQTIVAAQILYERNIIDRVIVIAPAAVRSVWFDPELGELKKHLWDGLPASVLEFHSKVRTWQQGPVNPQSRHLQWVITNYEFIRSKQRLEQLKVWCSNRTMLVLDESSAVKSYKAQQSKACTILRRTCGRVLLLNGTPIANNPIDIYSQANIMDPRILNCVGITHFRARYCVMGGFREPRFNRPVQIVGWQNLDDLQTRLAPYVMRRLKADCLDLPEKLPPVTLTAALTPESWTLYKEMRDEMVAWLKNGDIATATQAMTKAMRLSQITSGFLGGIENIENDGNEQSTTTVSVGREKLDVFLAWLAICLEENPNAKIVVWCHFRAELARLFSELEPTGVRLGKIWGKSAGMSEKAFEEERTNALRLLDPRTAPEGPAIVLGTPSSGSMGLNLTAATIAVYISNDYSLKTRLQSEDRLHRQGQRNPVSYFDIVATGPTGQKTIDFQIIKALRAKQDLATFTTSAWLKTLEEE